MCIALLVSLGLQVDNDNQVSSISRYPGRDCWVLPLRTLTKSGGALRITFGYSLERE